VAGVFQITYTRDLLSLMETSEARVCLSASEFSVENTELKENVKASNITLSVVLYGCETWSLTLRKEHRLKVFEKKVLRRIFRSKKPYVTGGRRELHNEELYKFYSSNITMMKSREKHAQGM
jgi:hypothetical protein